MKENHYTDIRKILLTSMIVVPLVPFVVILGIGYYYFTTSLENSTITRMERIVEDHGQMIESFLSERKADLDLIVHSYTYEQLIQPEKLAKVFEHLQRNSNAFVDLGIFNREGIHVAYYGPFKLTGKVYKETDWFKNVLKQGYYISDIFLGYRQIPHFIIAVVREDAGEKWVIRATIDSFMFNNLVKRVRIGKTGEAYILNADGILQTERRSGGNLMTKPPDNIEYPAASIGIKSFMNTDATGEKYLLTATWLKDKKWLLVVRQEKADVFHALRAAAYLIILIMIIGGVAIISVAFYLSERIVKRMEEMDSEKERLGQQLIRASRLAELGEMATGFAHEINNPLQIIKNEQSLIEMNLEELIGNGQLKPSASLAELEDSIDQIKLQIDRCANITQAILKFGRQSDYVSKDVDLQAFIKEISAMVAQKARVHGIAIKQAISADTPVVHGDPSQLQQVLLNLFNNAIDAIVERHGSHGGELVIESGPEDNRRVKLLVRDNGCGISPDNLRKIFTPFFTTKPVGKGTGLGLSVCYGIIDNLGGVMDVSSEKGRGTTFTIILPAAV
ncbi:MAG: two-component sensor histidine kinase [Proteobacteria bacterium]|nr:two-component sensor histidine kinase [Pseudomonadota bacterium]